METTAIAPRVDAQELERRRAARRARRATRLIDEERFPDSLIDVDATREWRCSYCDKLMMKGTLGAGTNVELLCSRPSCQRKIRFAVLDGAPATASQQAPAASAPSDGPSRG